MSFYTTESLVMTRLKMIEMYLWKGRTSYEVKEIFGISRKTFFKWLKRYREEGREGLKNRRPGLKTNRKRVSSLIEEQIVQMRLDTPFGPLRISYELRRRGISISPHGVYNVLKRRGLNRLLRYKEERDVIRYEKKKPFELVHIDIKYVGNLKGQGRVYQFTSIDSATRVAYAKLYRRKTGSNALSFLKEVYLFSEFRVRSILTDNGLEFTSIRGCPSSHMIDRFCLANSIKHKLTRKRRPQTNGKVERFHRTVEEEFYRRNFFFNIEEMEEGLKGYLKYYNNLRPHMGLKGLTPGERIKELEGIKVLKEDLKINLDNRFYLGRIRNEVCSHPI